MKERRDVFFAIADESRRAILERLAKERQPLPINSIAGDFNISRPAISKHIKVLNESGLVTTEYRGRENYVSLQAQQMAEVFQWVSLFEEFWNTKLNNLKNLVELTHKNERTKNK